MIYQCCITTKTRDNEDVCVYTISRLLLLFGSIVLLFDDVIVRCCVESRRLFVAVDRILRLSKLLFVYCSRTAADQIRVLLLWWSKVAAAGFQSEVLLMFPVVASAVVLMAGRGWLWLWFGCDGYRRWWLWWFTDGYDRGVWLWCLLVMMVFRWLNVLIICDPNVLPKLIFRISNCNPIHVHIKIQRKLNEI